MDAWIALAFFLFVMGAVAAAGWVVLQSRDGGASLFGRAFASVGHMVPAAKQASNPVRRQLTAAGYFHEPALAIFYGLRCAAALGVAALVAAASVWLNGDGTRSFVPAIAGAGFGYMLPARLLRRAIRQRRARLRRALPTAIDLCILSLEAGQSLDQSIIDTGRGLRRSHPDLGEEFQILYREARTSNNRPEALHNLGTRTQEPEIRKLMALLNDADRFGGSIAPALRNHARYLRIRMRQQAQEAARKVSVKLIFPIFFLIFPAVLLVTLGPALIMVTTQLRAVLK